MYSFYLDSIRLPIPPPKLTLKIENRNKTFELLNLGEINILKKEGLTNINLSITLPGVEYPFANYEGGFKKPSYYLDHLEKLKTDLKPFRFIVSRISPTGDFLFDTNMLVSIENYSIIEDALNGFDIVVDITLKRFKPYGTQILKIQQSKSDGISAKAVIEQKRPSKEPINTYSVKPGDTLWTICKRELGDGSKYKEIAKLNGIKNPNSIDSGQVLRLG